MAQARKEAGDSPLVFGRELSSHIIRVFVKTAWDCQEFLLAENSSVHHFKKQISKRLHCNTDRLVLIFTGKILRDQDILSQRGILDGTTVHLVVRTHPKGALPGPRTGHYVHGSEPSTSDSAGMLARLSQLARSSPDLADFIGQLTQLLTVFLEDPMVQGLANENSANASHAPESSRPVQKPELALKALETLQNQARQKELLQADKQGLEALKAVPGGDNAMHPVCPDIQQLMLFTLAPLFVPKGHNPSSELCKEEASAHSSTNPTTNIPTASAPARPFAQKVSAEEVTWAKRVASNQANSGCGAGMPDVSLGQDLLFQDGQQTTGKALNGQLRPSPSALHTALHILQQNPALLHRLATGSPLRHHMPLLLILTNPRALQALIQITKGLQILSKEVAALGPCLWGQGRPHGTRQCPKARTGGQGQREDSIQPTLAVLQLLHALANACSQSTQSSLHSSPLTEGLYQQELEHLRDMGFTNHDANLQTLMTTGRDFHAAIEKILGVPEAQVPPADTLSPPSHGEGGKGRGRGGERK